MEQLEVLNNNNTLRLKMNGTPETFYCNCAKIGLISIKIGTQPAYDVIQ